MLWQVGTINYSGINNHLLKSCQAKTWIRIQIVDFVVLTVWSCRGIQDLGGTGSEYRENVVGYTFRLSFFAGVISELHVKTLVMQAASQLVVNCKMASFECIFHGAEKKVRVRWIGTVGRIREKNGRRRLPYVKWWLVSCRTVRESCLCNSWREVPRSVQSNMCRH
jgi:hypothetical protein